MALRSGAARPRSVRGRTPSRRSPRPRREGRRVPRSSSRWSPRPTTRCWRSTRRRGAHRRGAQAAIRRADHRLAGHPVLCGFRRSRTRACSPCSTPSSTCPRRWTCRRPSATPRQRRSGRGRRKPFDDEPFGLAFKVAAHPFFGKLTFVRVYSGLGRLRRPGDQLHQRARRSVGMFQMHANKRSRSPACRRR